MTGMSPAPKPVGSARAAKPTRTPDPVRPLAGWIRQRRAHAIVGTLMVATASGAPVAEVPLVVMVEIEQAGIFGRAWDSLRLWIK